MLLLQCVMLMLAFAMMLDSTGIVRIACGIWTGFNLYLVIDSIFDLIKKSKTKEEVCVKP